MAKFRTGRTLGRTLYMQTDDDASKDDVFLGIVETRELAQFIVGTLNGVLGPVKDDFVYKMLGKDPALIINLNKN